MTVASAQDFTDVASEIGESVSIYNPTDAIDTDYGASTADNLGDATSENVVIQPATEDRNLNSDGKLLEGSLFAMFISSSVVTKDSLIKFDNKYYKVKNLIEVRPTGTIHHFESNLELVRDTSE